MPSHPNPRGAAKISVQSAKVIRRDHMSERKNLKIAKDTYDELREEKRDMETWDSMLRRLMREDNDE